MKYLRHAEPERSASGPRSTAELDHHMPVAERVETTTAPGKPVTITLTAHDDLHHALSIAITSKPLHGTVASTTDADVVYTPATDFVGMRPVHLPGLGRSGLQQPGRGARDGRRSARIHHDPGVDSRRRPCGLRGDHHRWRSRRLGAHPSSTRSLHEIDHQLGEDGVASRWPVRRGDGHRSQAPRERRSALDRGLRRAVPGSRRLEGKELFRQHGADHADAQA